MLAFSHAVCNLKEFGLKYKVYLNCCICFIRNKNN